MQRRRTALEYGPAWVAALVSLAAVAGCDAGTLHERGLRTIRWLHADAAARLLEQPDVLLLRVGGASWSLDGDPGAGPWDHDAPLPLALRDTSATVLILAEDRREALRLAARLTRSGIQEVALIRGGVAAWEAARRSESPEPDSTGADPGLREPT